MELTKTSNLKEANPAKEKNISVSVLLCIGMGILLTLRGIHDIFIYPAIIWGLAGVLFAKKEDSVILLFFTLPLGAIFKLSPDEFSFFTLMFLLFATRLIISKTKIRVSLICLLFMFVAYAFLISGISQAVNIITMALGVFFVAYAIKEEISFNRVVVAYSFGIAVSAVLGLLQNKLPIIQEYVVVSILNSGATAESVSRFAGLKGNPNYFTMDVILALAGIAIMLLTKKAHIKFHFVLFSLLSVIGVMSISKSFLLSWGVLLLLMIYSSLKMAPEKTAKVILVIGSSLVIIGIFASDYIRAYLLRLSMDEGASLSEITTGRWDIWVSYIKAIWNDVKILLFGNGIGGSLVGGRGAHNTYLEVIYNLGILGGSIYAFLMSSLFKGIANRAQRQIIQYAPLIVFLVRLLGIGIFTDDSMWFFLLFIALSLKTNTGNDETVIA